jgi:RNA polymerase sigma-70 factor (ECF subfamily)
MLENDVKEELYRVCCQLKPPYKEVALAYFYKEMTVNEIQESTGKNGKTLQTQIYRAKAMLKKLWRKEIG